MGSGVTIGGGSSMVTLPVMVGGGVGERKKNDCISLLPLWCLLELASFKSKNG